MTQYRRAALAVLAVSALTVAFALALAPAARAQDAPFPSKPVKILVGYAPGGPLDSVSRAIAPKLAEDLKVPVLVENRPGASGVVAGDVVVRSPPDGYTLILQGITHSILPGLNAKLPFDTLADFTPVAIVGWGPLVLVVNASLPVTTVAELVALARKDPGKLSYASAGNGTSLHIAGEMLKRTAKIDMVHVPYKGSAPAIADVIAGHVQVMIDVVPSALPHIKSGRLRALAVTGSKRLPELADVPTIAEAGYPEADFATWWGILGPARMPKSVVDRLSVGLQRALQNPEVRERFATLGGEPAWSTPEEFDRVLRQDVARFTAVIKDAGIKAD